MNGGVFNMKAPRAFLAQFDEVAAVRGLNRSQLVKALVREEQRRLAGEAPLPAVADEDEVLVALTEKVRVGHVSAMKLLLERLDLLREGVDDDEGEATPEDPFDALDELAARRTAAG